MRFFFKLIFKILGWRIEGTVPQEKKFIMIVAPHTSYWDFFVGVAARSILGLKTHFLAKKEIFRFPVAGILRWMGGYPVDRRNAAGMVEAVAAIFHSKEEFSIAIAPEGTRKKVEKMKTGFWRIAKEAGVPIVMVGFDFKRRVVELKPPFLPGSLESDMAYILSYYRTVAGKRPEKGLS